jgi:hypothetical protein
VRALLTFQGTEDAHGRSVQSTEDCRKCVEPSASQCWVVYMGISCLRVYRDTPRSRDSSVSVVTRLRAGRPGLGSRQGQGIFSLHHRVQTGSGAHPASSPMGAGGRALTPAVERSGLEADHSSPSNAEVKNL